MSSTDAVQPDPNTTDVVGARIGAQLVDLLLLFIQTVVVAMAFAALFPPETEAGVRGYVFFGVLTLPLYGGLLESYWNGQTVGKRLAGIKVVDWQGEDPSLGQALLRNVPALVLLDWLTTAVALAAIATDDRRQRLLDRVADAYVVRVGARSYGSEPRL